MDDLLKTIEELEKQEKEIVFKSFGPDDAFDIGVRLINKAKEMNVYYAISVSLNRRKLFHFSMDGACPDNDRWIMRKENVVYNFFKSSLRVRLEFERDGFDFNQMFALSNDQFANFGGGFPINVEGVGVVGTVSISGLPHELDHQYVVDVLREYLAK